MKENTPSQDYAEKVIKSIMGLSKEGFSTQYFSPFMIRQNMSEPRPSYSKLNSLLLDFADKDDISKAVVVNSKGNNKYYYRTKSLFP